jgi:CheY-like chemotaxis protein
MILKDIPSFYFYPRVLLLDDDTALLDIVQESLNEFFIVETYNQPHNLIKRVQPYQKFLDIVENSREQGEDSNIENTIVHINYKVVANEIIRVYKENQFISVIFLDYFMPLMNGIECAREIIDLNVCKILLTASLEDKYVIDVFNENIIQQYISKNNENIIDDMKSLIYKYHSKIIERLNKMFFGDCLRVASYKDLFASEEFSNIYHKTVSNHKIIFSCVYEVCGSMIMIDDKDNHYLFNVYKEQDLKDVLFVSNEFETSLSDLNKQSCKNFERLVDYKDNSNESFLGSSLSNKITDQFSVVNLDRDRYYISFKHKKYF